MMNGMGDMMKKAQKMQEEMQKAQEEAAKSEVTGESGAGLIKLIINGGRDVRKVDIDDSLLAEDKEVLEDLLAAAINDAVRRVEADQKDRMSGLMSGMGLPSNFKMPF